jgi:hypothetical protein
LTWVGLVRVLSLDRQGQIPGNHPHLKLGASDGVGQYHMAAEAVEKLRFGPALKLSGESEVSRSPISTDRSGSSMFGGAAVDVVVRALVRSHLCEEVGEARLESAMRQVEDFWDSF